MKYCSHCGAEVSDDAVVCVKCGCAIANVSKGVENPNESTMVYSLIGFFIPIVGLVLYLMWQQEQPRRAKAAGKGALLSVGISVALIIVSMIIMFSL